MNEALIYLLRMAVGTADAADAPQIDAACWPQIYEECRRQAIVGVIGTAVGQRPKVGRPPMALWMQWVANVAAIERRNREILTETERLASRLKGVGLTMKVLKGQSIARYYPEPLIRQPGDIDAWVTSGYSSLTDLFSKLHSLCEGRLERPTYHHVEWRTKSVSVEVHYRPSFFFNPLRNRRFQLWARQEHDDASFNRIFLLVHIFRHVVSEGIGLRQMMDYACLLKQCPASDQERAEAVQTLRRLGLQHFAAAVMYVMQAVFGIDADHLLMPPDNKMGRQMLREIRLSGNFGQFDTRIDTRQLATEGGSFWLHTRHRLRFLATYPSEVLFDIPFRLWHYTYRLFWTQKLRNLTRAAAR